MMKLAVEQTKGCRQLLGMMIVDWVFDIEMLRVTALCRAGGRILRIDCRNRLGGVEQGFFLVDVM